MVSWVCQWLSQCKYFYRSAEASYSNCSYYYYAFCSKLFDTLGYFLCC